MKITQINPDWPNSLRWFLTQNLQSFSPWHLISKPGEFDFAAKQFTAEDLQNGEIFVFASRQDRDDFAGFVVEKGKIHEKVLSFHPSFGSMDSGNSIANQEFEDIFYFFSKAVMPDMKEWALTEDASDLLD